jgi:hypothetical protein
MKGKRSRALDAARHTLLLDDSEKRKLLDPRSPTSKTFRREKLAQLEEIARVFNEQWWPEMQKHCKADLRLDEADSKQIRLTYISAPEQGDNGL